MGSLALVVDIQCDTAFERLLADVDQAQTFFLDQLCFPGVAFHYSNVAHSFICSFGRCQEGENKVGGHGSVVAVLPHFFYDIKYVGGTEHRVDACFVEKVELVSLFIFARTDLFAFLPGPLC